MYRIYQNLKMRLYLSQSRYAEALAVLGDRPWPRSGREQWAAYRQGLFATVSTTQWDGKSMYGGMAVATSLAICGHRTEAEALVQKLNTRWNARFFRSRIARLIAPYARDTALFLLRQDDECLGHKIVLLEQNGEADKARAMLQTALKTSRAEREPQLQLLASNLLESTPAGKLARLNVFLTSHGLAPLRLKDNRCSPVIGNIEGAKELPPADGPLVSILMTAYNICDRIGTALEGLLNQTWRNLEVIVVDDASNDGTGAVVQALAERDSRIRYFRLSSNAGTYVAKTFGFSKARGEFVTCHDSDDWSHPQRIERQALLLSENPDLVATISQWVRMEDTGRYHVRHIYPLMHPNPASTMFRRELVATKAGLWDAARIGADSEFNSRLHLVFGSKAIRRMALPLTLGAHRENSLMTATDTGYSADGTSPVRLVYWEAWARWHIHTLSHGAKPVMPPIAEPRRPFNAPETVLVPHNKVLAALGPAFKK